MIDHIVNMENNQIRSTSTTEIAYFGDCWFHCLLMMLEINRPRSIDMEMKNVRKPPLSPASMQACKKMNQTKHETSRNIENRVNSLRAFVPPTISS